MDKKITADAWDMLHSVLDWCMGISNTTKADCFFDYAPHVNCYGVHIYRNGWEEGAEAEYVDLSSDINEENLMKTIAELRHIESVLREKEEENV